MTILQGIIDNTPQTVKINTKQITFLVDSGICLKPSTMPQGKEGLIYFDTNAKVLRLHSNSTWNDISLTSDLSEYADMRVSAQLGVGGPGQLANGEHQYLHSEGSVAMWWPFSKDAFLNFNIYQSINNTMTFNQPLTFASRTELNYNKLLSIALPTVVSDAVSQAYINTAYAQASPTSIFGVANTNISTIRGQANAVYNTLLSLWNSRKTLSPSDPDDPDYWPGAASKTAMIKATQRMKNSGAV